MAISLDPHLLADLRSGSGEPRGGSIWQDPHIQHQLLAVHLEDSTTAATRSPQAVRRTIDLLTAGLAPGAAVLDLWVCPDDRPGVHRAHVGLFARCAPGEVRGLAYDRDRGAVATDGWLRPPGRTSPFT